MATIEHETVYKMTLTSREYAMLLNSISLIQNPTQEYTALREQMVEEQV